MRRIKIIVAAIGGLAAVSGAANAATMPQLDFANPLLKAQVIWGAMIFAAFYYLVSRVGLPRVADILEMRAEKIAKDLDQARDSRTHAEHAVAELTEARKKAFAQSQAAIAEALQKAKAEADARAAAQEAILEAQLAESEVRIGEARKAAMGGLRDVATDTAQAVVARLTRFQPDHGQVRDAVGRVLDDRKLSHAA